MQNIHIIQIYTHIKSPLARISQYNAPHPTTSNPNKSFWHGLTWCAIPSCVTLPSCLLLQPSWWLKPIGLSHDNIYYLYIYVYKERVSGREIYVILFLYVSTHKQTNTYSHTHIYIYMYLYTNEYLKKALLLSLLSWWWLLLFIL
jgi:hypothetical protein